MTIQKPQLRAKVKMPAKKRLTALYIRVSTRSQTYDAQENALQEYCTLKGWKPVECVIFREKVNGSAKTRPVLEQLMLRARSGEFSAVVVYKVDRLGRNTDNLLWVMGEFERMGVAVISATEPIDTSETNPLGKFTVNIMACVAELEKNTIRERTIAGQQAARKQGRHPGRPNKSEQHRAAAKQLREKGRTLDQIAEKLEISRASAQRLCKNVVGARPVRRQKAAKPRAQKYPPKNQGVLALQA